MGSKRRFQLGTIPRIEQPFGGGYKKAPSRLLK
nr:MAG TPA: hypothetical protein [Caudoviricetes sp.]